MGAEALLVGLEIGTTKICSVVAETQTDDTLRILGVGETPSRGVRKGEIVDYNNAQACIREALSGAEKKSDVEISSVFLGVTGSHLASVNNRGMVRIPADSEEVDEDDIEDVRTSARDVSIPEDHAFLHSISQHYYVDGKAVINPLGMLGRKLEADMHIVHGVANRIKDAIRCVREIDVEVEEVVLNGLASALVVLDSTQKEMGALVLDIGGGTTDYIAYVDGVVRCSGVLAVGGDHITNDISMGARIPMSKAESLKIAEGSVVLGNTLPGETITLKGDASFAAREIERETLNTIIHMRMRELFELIRRRLEAERAIEYLGAGVVLTGGSCQLNGLKHLAEDVFGVPATVTHAKSVAGVTSAFQRPELSTAIGLVKYGQAVQYDRVRPGFGGRLADVLSGIFRRLGPRKSRGTDSVE